MIYDPMGDGWRAGERGLPCQPPAEATEDEANRWTMGWEFGARGKPDVPKPSIPDYPYETALDAREAADHMFDRHYRVERAERNVNRVKELFHG